MGTDNETDISVKMDLLKGVNLFAKLGSRELAVVAENSGYYAYGKGDVIFSEGSYGDGLYVIRKGEVLITKKRGEDETINIAQFIAGECFGEMDLLENKKMTATASAETDAELLVFPAREIRFQDVLALHPDISASILHELMAVIAGRIRSTNRLISEKSQWVRELKHQLFYDKLTGLYNRTFLDEEFPRQLEEFGPETCIIMIKPDRFKAINDECGHEAGDKALRLIAFSIRSQFRQRDIAVRFRGDEFAVILPATGLDAARVFAGHVLRLLAALNYDHITGGGFGTTVSIGVAAYPSHAGHPKELVDLCFRRMFTAREGGGDRIISEGP